MAPVILIIAPRMNNVLDGDFKNKQEMKRY